MARGLAGPLVLAWPLRAPAGPAPVVSSAFGRDAQWGRSSRPAADEAAGPAPARGSLKCDVSSFPELPGDFCSHWERRPAHASRNLSGAFDHIFRLDDFDEMQATFSPYWKVGRDVRLSLNGEPLDHRILELRGQGLPIYESFREGLTLAVMSIDRFHSGTQAFCRRLEEMLGMVVYANLYWSPPWTPRTKHEHSGAFSTHIDLEDIAVLQIAGFKDWRVCKPSPYLAAGSDFQRSKLQIPDGDCMRVHMSPGDVLYLPRGTPHQAFLTEGAHSVHMSVSVASEQFTWAEGFKMLAEAQATVALPSETRKWLQQAVQEGLKLQGQHDPYGHIRSAVPLRPLLSYYASVATAAATTAAGGEWVYGTFVLPEVWSELWEEYRQLVGRLSSPSGNAEAARAALSSNQSLRSLLEGMRLRQCTAMHFVRKELFTAVGLIAAGGVVPELRLQRRVADQVVFVPSGGLVPQHHGLVAGQRSPLKGPPVGSVSVWVSGKDIGTFPTGDLQALRFMLSAPGHVFAVGEVPSPRAVPLAEALLAKGALAVAPSQAHVPTWQQLVHSAQRQLFGAGGVDRPREPPEQQAGVQGADGRVEGRGSGRGREGEL